MPEQKRRSRTSKKSSSSEDGAGVDDVTETAKDAGEEATGQAQDAGDEATGQAEQAGSGASGAAQTVTSEIKKVVRESAIEVLSPVARQATTQAAKYAASKGPELIAQNVLPKLKDAGGAGGLAKMAGGVLSDQGGVGGLVGKVMSGGGGGGGDKEATGYGRGRRMPIQQSVDVAVPLRTAYNQWTQFEEWPKFMHRLNQASQEDECTIRFTEKMWGFTRPFTGQIVEQQPDERIKWKVDEGPKHTGTVTFHELAERLTRIEVNLDQEPSGIVEKTARGARFSKRATRADLHRFKAYIEMLEEETGAWRGTIEDGEVVKSHEDAVEEEEREEPEAEEYEEDEAGAEAEAEEEPEEEVEEEAEEEPEAEAEEEPEAEAEEEPEAEAEEEEEEEEKPKPKRKSTRRRSSPRRRSPAGRGR